ncbi:MAG: hypothetical protein WC455_21920 [Dehalococcoidia bacterium]|jgi:hypothetical protein
MTEIVTTRVLYPDSIELGTPGKGGCIHVFFDSGDLTEASHRIDTAVLVRERLLSRLAASGGRV